MTVCPKCQSNVKDGQRFCNVCGTNVPAAASGAIPPVPSKVYCEQCGRELNKLMKFCKYCGAVQKNFAELAAPGKATEMIGAPPTGDMQGNTASQGATEVIRPDMPHPAHNTGPAGSPMPTQIMTDNPSQSNTGQVGDNRTNAFQDTQPGLTAPSGPFPPPVATTGGITTAMNVPSSNSTTGDFGGTSGSGQFFNQNAPTQTGSPSQDFGQNIPTTDRFNTVTDNQPMRAIPPVNAPTVPVNTPPSMSANTPTAPVNQPPATFNTSTFPLSPEGQPSQPQSGNLGTQQFTTPASTQQPPRTAPIPTQQVSYNAMPPTAQVQTGKKRSAIVPMILAIVLALFLGGGALGAYFAFFRKPAVVVDNNTIPGKTGNTDTPQQPNPTDPNGQQISPQDGPLTPQQQEQKKKDEEKKNADPQGKQNTDDQKRQQEEAKKAEEQKRIEDQKKSDAQAKIDEQKRQDDLRKQQEDQKRADAQAKLDEQKRQDDLRRQQEEQKRQDDIRKQEEAKRNQARSGTISWSATVQGQYNIVIRGGGSSVQTLSGAPIQQSASLSAALPSVPVRFSLRGKQGKVRIFQSPGPSNGYIGIIRVEGNNERVSFTVEWDVLQ